MTDTTESTTPAPDADTGSKKRGGGLSTMLIADLKSMASGMGIAGAGSMKKAQLVDAIKAEVPIWKHQHFTDGRSEWVGL